MNHSNLLINEPPLIVLPGLAKAIGLNEAIILQQVFFWSSRSMNKKDGKQWVYNTYAGWAEQFPFWSEMTIRRAITNLEKSGLLLSTSEYNKMPMDKTKWYAIDHNKLNSMNRPSDHIEQTKTDQNEQSTSDQNEHSNNHRTPKNTKELKEYICIDDLEHVRITQKEFDKLKELLGSHSDVIDYLYRFESWIITQTAKKQKTASAYLSVRTWYRNDQKKGTGGKYVSAAERSSQVLNEALRKELGQGGTGRHDITHEVHREDVQQLPSGRGENHHLGGLF